MGIFNKGTPTNTREEVAKRVYEAQRKKAFESQGRDSTGALNGVAALTQPIGKDQIHKAAVTLNRYKEGKANLEKKIIDNEQWYKLRHWECMRDKNADIQPTSAWLHNSIVNKLATAMDNYPRINVLPREEGDKTEAEMLSSIIPVILEQNGFDETYEEEQSYKLKTGAGVYGVFWDSTKLNGLGDVSIKQIDLLNLFFESGITDIQKSRNVFHVELMDNDLLVEAYPQLTNKLGGSTINVSKYIYDDKVDTTQKSAVVDWYYKKNVNGRTVLHFCKFVNDEVLFATENDPNYAERGWYDHGLYPFVADPLYRIEGSIAGFGAIDVGKDTQAYIDRGNQAIMENMLSNAAPRYFVRTDGGINEEEYADLSKKFVHYEGTANQDSIVPIQGKPLSDIYVSVINNKIEELKETTGNRDVSSGGTTGGVTAASGLAAQMEAGAKLDRLNGKGSFRAFKQVCNLIIELIRQFYDMPRQFRIVGENGAMKYVQYSNAGIKPQYQGNDFGEDMGYRLPVFDLEISAERQSPYSRLSQNELALEFYQAGFFNPQMADQALACLDMMDFSRKEFIMKKISENGTMYQMLMQAQQQVVALASVIDGLKGTNYAQQFAAQMGGAQIPMQTGGVPTQKVAQTEALGGEANGESTAMRNAREKVAESTDPT